MNAKETIQALGQEKAGKLMADLYGSLKTAENRTRYEKLVDQYVKTFGDGDLKLFSSPGRTEISGNHTDHNHGKVLAGSINLDCAGVAAKNNSDQIRIVSETYNQDFTIDLNQLEVSPKAAGTIDLVKGMLKGFTEFGYQIGGFNAYITSNVISAAGVSSSAAFEMLICSMLNTFFNEGKMDTVAYAHIGKYAENHYWNKASGLLDQMACAVGGLISIDFVNPAEPAVEKIDFDMEKYGYRLCITDTKGSHADLTDEYAAIPKEMKLVAKYFGKEVLCGISINDVLDNITDLRKKLGDRCVLRALHFIYENKRVQKEVSALKAGNIRAFLDDVKASGNSSFKYLQNVYSNQDIKNQNVSLALFVSEMFLGQNGVCRVHGGGFAGTIQAFVKNGYVENYKYEMDKIFGKDSCKDLRIRKYGGIKVL